MSEEENLEVEETEQEEQEQPEQPETEESALEDGGQSEEEESDTSTADDSSEKPKKGFQKRINELTAKRRSAEQERDYWRMLAQEKEQDVEKPQVPRMPDPALKLDNPEQYEEQLAKWQEEFDAYTEKRVEYTEHQKKSEASKQQSETIANELLEEWQEKAEAFKQDVPDFDAVMTDEKSPISEHMFQIALRSEQGPQVLYELVKNNPAEAKRIYGMNPAQTAYEMGKVEARLAVKPKTKTAAPDPVSTVSGGGEKGTQVSDEMPIDQWMEMERKRLAAKT